MSAPARVVVVGCSVAGLTAAEALRRRGHDGEIVLIGAESHLPYDRPPLSKQILAGTWEVERTALRRSYADLELDFRLGRPAERLSLDGRVVEIAGGERIDYDMLIIATGADPRPLPGGHAMRGVHTLRTLDDALALRAALTPGARLVVIGAGYLGTEVAAAARARDAAVTLVDPLPAPVMRPLGRQVGSLVADLHRAHGVELRMGVGVRALQGDGGRVVGVEFDDGSVVGADAVLVAIGALPAVGWLASSGLALNDGVVCDACCAAAPGVYAAGDVANWPNPHFGVRMRLEHRMNATEQGMAVARNVLGDETAFAPIPYFWTDQYDVKLAAYGIFPPNARTEVVHGALGEGSFVITHAIGDRVVGAVGWNAPRQLRAVRAEIAEPAGLVELA